jgi:Flp pilus assembly pilin Flp
MFQLMLRVWQDDSGALIATEWVFIATMLVLGLVTGLSALSSAINGELLDLANAISSLNQSYSFGGSSGCCASTAGSFFLNTVRPFFSFSGCVPAPTLFAVGCP